LLVYYKLHCTPGDVALGGSKISEGIGHFNDSWKPHGFDTKKIFLSPTIEYAGMEAYARKHEFTAANKKKHNIQVAFEVWIRPGSYTKGPETVLEAHQKHIRLSRSFRNDELEWATKERGATILCGLLVKISDI
jgi:hypothetical protein